MRKENALQVLRLAVALRGSRVGLTLDDIREMFSVTERTAHRLRNAVAELFPDIEMRIGDDRRRYWRLPGNSVGALIDVSADELAALTSAVRVLSAHGYEETARTVNGLGEKVRALTAPAVARRLDPDVEALVEAEGVAIRPGPRPRRNPEVLEALREAIKGCRPVRLHYRYRNSDVASDVEAHPYGVLLGSRHYLVAHRPGAVDGPFLRMYSMPEIDHVDLLDGFFVRDPAVSLQAFADRAFGIFQEEPQTVVWRFSGRAVRDARNFLFHPSQTVKELPDGRFEVAFSAGGLLEMCWHLFTWGNHVEVVEPLALRRLYETCLAAGGAPPAIERDDRQADLFDL